MFEPSRLAATHLVDAYSQVVPLRLRATHTHWGSTRPETATATTASTLGGPS